MISRHPSLSFFIFTLIISLSFQVHAAGTIIVDAENDTFDVIDDNDGLCSLREAFSLAQGNIEERGCILSGDLENEVTLRIEVPTLQFDRPANEDNTGGALLISNNIIVESIQDNGSEITGNGKNPFFKVLRNGRLTLSNLTLKNGGSPVTDSGGAIQSQGYLKINNLKFEENQGHFGGGALVQQGGQLIIENSIFQNNHACTNGGAVFLQNVASYTISHSQFLLNSAQFGGAINIRESHNFSSQAQINDTLFAGNRASRPHLNDLICNPRNDRIFPGLSGGAVFIEGNSNANRELLIASSVFLGNSANFGGGLLNLGKAMIRNSSFINNLASDFGGALFNISTLESEERPWSILSNIQMVNTTISDNSATYGGGIFNSPSSNIDILHGTIIRNSASTNPDGLIGNSGGVYNFDSGTISIEKSILTLNKIDGSISEAKANCAGKIETLGYNIIGYPTGCDINYQDTDFDDTEIEFTELQENEMGFPAFYFPLGDDNLAINAIPLESCTQDEGAFLNDLLGDARGLCRGSEGGCEIGAIEIQSENNLNCLTENIVENPDWK